MDEKKGKKVKVEKIGRKISSKEEKREKMIGMGIKKMKRSRKMEDNKEVSGMIEKIKKIVRVVEEE